MISPLSDTDMNIKLLKKGDLAVIIAVAVAALIFAFLAKPQSDRPVAVISVDGVEVEGTTYAVIYTNGEYVDTVVA